MAIKVDCNKVHQALLTKLEEGNRLLGICQERKTAIAALFARCTTLGTEFKDPAQVQKAKEERAELEKLEREVDANIEQIKGNLEKIREALKRLEESRT